MIAANLSEAAVSVAEAQAYARVETGEEEAVLAGLVRTALVNSGQVLLNADVDAMIAGANLAMVGEELIQFGRAEQLEPGLFRLSRMLRGRRGTEWASPMHQAGERFCLFHPTALSTIELPAHASGALLSAVSHGAGDAPPLPEFQRLVSGEAMRPLPVCHLRATRDGAFLHLSWVRRSHRGWAWNDGVGVPSDSFAERYRVSVTGPAGRLEIESDTPGANLPVASLPAEVGQTIDVEVGAIGPMALSRPRAIKLIL